MEELESSLLGLVASLHEPGEGLLARSVLASADDATALCHHEIRLHEATAGVLGRAVVDLGLGANRHLRSSRSLTSGRLTSGRLATHCALLRSKTTTLVATVYDASAFLHSLGFHFYSIYRFSFFARMVSASFAMVARS